jgi:hypothetical protein
MSIQNSVNVASFLGKETTEGTAVAATKRLQSTAVMLKPETEVTLFRPNGSEYDTLAQQGKEWSTFGVEGKLSFTDITYLLSMLVKGGITPSSSGTNGKLWAFAPSDTIDTFTIDYGDSVEAERAAGCFLDSLSININRSESNISGSGIGRLLTYAASLDGSPVNVAQKVVDTSDWIVKFADSQSALSGASESCKVYEANLNISGRWGVHWPLCSTNTSHAGRVKKVPTIELGLSITNESEGRAFITTNLRGNTGKYIRLENTGAVITGATPSAYKIVIEFFGFVKSAPQPKDLDDLVVLPFVFGGAKVSDLLTAYTIDVTNELASL